MNDELCYNNNNNNAPMSPVLVATIFVVLSKRGHVCRLTSGLAAHAAVVAPNAAPAMMMVRLN